jgi:hypothetical protein
MSSEQAVLDDIDSVLATLDPFEVAWANGREEYKRYTEQTSAQYWYDAGMRAGRMAQLEESNRYLRLRIEAREIA